MTCAVLEHQSKIGPLIKRGRPKIASRRYDDLSFKQKQAFATPGGFGRLFLKIPLTPKQEAICNAFAPQDCAVSALCANETGKSTYIIPTVVLWHASVFTRRDKEGGAMTTSGSWNQIRNQLVPAMKIHAHLFPGWEFQEREIKAYGLPQWVAFSTRETGRAEGFHGSPEHPLLAIVDEAKSVKDGIFRAIEDRCRPQRKGFLSSPGYAVGTFYDSHHSQAALYERFKLTVDDSPWINRAQMERVIKKAGAGNIDRGLKDPLVRSAYFAEFMPFVADALVSFADIEECLAEPPGYMPGERHVRCDFAAGGDENVIAVRVGNKVWIADAWRDTDTMSAIGRFILNFSKLKKDFGVKPEEIEGDADGLGKPMIDRLREAGWPILEYHANAAAFSGEQYRNRASQEWFVGAAQIKERQWIIPDDGELKAQLTDRQGKYESNGRCWIESKDDLFRRQIRDQRPKRSPDRAETVLGAMAPLPLLRPIQVMGTQRDPFTVNQIEVPETLLQSLGGFAGD